MKRSAKFLSVLLVMALCVGFVPSAYALGNVVIGGPELGMFEESYGVTTVPSPTPTTDPSASQKPEDAEPSEGDVVVTEEPEESEDPSGEKAISVATAAELRQALKDIAYKGRITVTADIEDLTAPLTIEKSMTIDLGGNTLFFVPGGAVQSCAIYVAPGVKSVNIVNGQLEIGSETDEDENVYGYTNGIVSNAGWLGLNWLDIRGTLTGAMLVNENEDGDLEVMCGDFMSDPSAFVNSEEYTVEETEDGWKVREIEKEEPPVEPTDEPTDETPASPSPSPETPAEPTPSAEPTEPVPEGVPVDPDAADVPEGEENDGYTSDLMSGDKELGLGMIAQVADNEKMLKAWAEKGSDTPVLVTSDIELKENLDVAKDLALNLNGKKITGTGILVTNVAGLSLRDGTVETKISNTGKLDLTGVTAQDVTCTSGSVNLLPGTSVETLTVSAGEAVVDAGQVKKQLLIEGGSVSLTGTADVESIVMTGGTLNVLGSDGVNVGTVSIKGDVELNIDSGTFEEMGFDSNAAKGISLAGVYQIGGTKVTGGKFLDGLNEIFIGEGYTMGPDNEIMPISVEGSSSVVDGQVQDGKALYFKGTAEELGDIAQPSFYLDFTKVDNGSSGKVLKLKLTALNATSSPASVELTQNTDFTYEPDKNENDGGTVTLKTGSATLNGLTPGAYKVEFVFNTESTGLDQRIFVFPRIEYTDAKYIIGTGDTVVLKTGKSGTDDPKAVTFAKDAGHKKEAATTLTLSTDYELSSQTLTVKDSALKGKATTAGTYYLGLWYEYNDCIYVPITVREKPSAVPSSQNWLYNGGDVTVTVYSAANKATGVSGGTPAIAPADYTISTDGRTVTIKGDYLRRQVDTKTGDGHGAQTFTIQTEDGNVPIVINIRPALWPRNNESTHRKGSDADLIFDCSAPINTAYAPTLGTKSISADDADGYKIEGNTITLKAAFLNKRASQDWTLGVTTTVAGDVVAYANFKVTGTSSGGTGVATGDENNAVVWAVVLVLSGAAVVALIPKKKKQQED